MSEPGPHLVDAVARDIPPGPRDVADGRGREVWDLRERVAELTARAAELVERERIQALELSALHREVDVKSAYNTMLERAALERRERVLWLEAALDRARTDDVEERLRHAEDMIAAERARISYRVSRRVIRWFDRHPFLRRVVLGMLTR